MKVTIITVCLNSQKTIIKTLNSVLNQTHKNIEHIVIDGGSTDSTQVILFDYPHKNKKFFIKKGYGLYKSLNFAIKQATGEYLIVLHSDDIFNNNNIISRLVEISKKKKYDLILGSIVFFKNFAFEISRHYPSKNFKIADFKTGLMPPHTGSFVKKNICRKFFFNENCKIAGDFDFFLRSIYLNKASYITTNLLVTRMKTGGVSGRNLNSYLTSTSEIYQSLIKNNIKTSYHKILLRFLYKIPQFLAFNYNKFNKHYFSSKNKFYKNALLYDFTIYKKTQEILKKKKYILSAMNLAFLGSFCENYKLKFPYIFHWPDGISAKLLNRKIKKIPGRKVLENLKIPKNIKRIIVVGNLTILGRDLLTRKYKKKIVHYKVPYDSANNIIKSLKYSPTNHDLVFITLPTPKQELIAIEMAKKFKYCKIICIGGSIGILSGEEKSVPAILINFEFIWRIRYETKRRTIRLFKTFVSVCSDYIFSQKIKNIKINYK